MWRTVVLFVGLVALARSHTTSVSQCTNHAGDLPINTSIENCDTPPCHLPQLQDAVVNMVFRAPRTMRSMRTLVTAYLLFVPIQHDLEENAHTCNFLTNSYCPVMEGEVLEYTLRMYIEPIFPVGIAVTLEFRVVDENDLPVLCIRVPIRVAEPLNNAKLGSNNATVTIVDRV